MPIEGLQLADVAVEGGNLKGQAAQDITQRAIAKHGMNDLQVEDLSYHLNRNRLLLSMLLFPKFEVLDPLELRTFCTTYRYYTARCLGCIDCREEGTKGECGKVVNSHLKRIFFKDDEETHSQLEGQHIGCVDREDRGGPTNKHASSNVRGCIAYNTSSCTDARLRGPHNPRHLPA